MRKRVLRIMAIFAVLISAAACGDTPTGPVAELPGANPATYDEVEGCVVGGICVLPPISSGGGGSTYCDPRVSDCGDGGWNTCITGETGTGDPYEAYTNSCPGGGGGGGGDGGGGGSGGDGSTPPPSDLPAPVDTYKTGEQVIDAPGVQSQFQQLWTKSKLMGVEQGGWIVSGGGTFQLIPFRNAQYSACGIDVYEALPSGTVAIMHTHPWPLWTATPCGGLNTGTPSDEDRAALGLAGVSVGYFLDEGGIGKYTATAGVTAIRAERCGY